MRTADWSGGVDYRTVCCMYLRYGYSLRTPLIGTCQTATAGLRWRKNIMTNPRMLAAGSTSRDRKIIAA